MAANDRALDALYASLTPEERARLLARLWRAHDDRELDRLLRTIPDHVAGISYNRASAVLRWLHGELPAFVALTTSQMQTEFWRLAWVTSREFDRWKARDWLRRAWWFVAYPVTEAEYRRLVALDRSEPETLAAYCDWLAEFEGTEPGLRPEVAALLEGLPADLRREFRDDWSGEPPSPNAVQDDIRRGAAIAKRLRALLNAAVERGELPPPTRTGAGSALPRGVLSDWGEGTTTETYEPVGPGYFVPALELVGGDGIDWDVWPDAEAETVGERRAALWRAFAGIVCEAAHLAIDELESLSLEPPATLAERERAAAAVQRLWPWGLDGLRDALRIEAGRHARSRAELHALRWLVEEAERETFGGEDPLDPLVRGLLERCEAAARDFERSWTAAVDAAGTPIGGGMAAWPPALDGDEGYAVELHARLRADLCGEG